MYEIVSGLVIHRATMEDETIEETNQRTSTVLHGRTSGRSKFYSTRE